MWARCGGGISRKGALIYHAESVVSCALRGVLQTAGKERNAFRISFLATAETENRLCGVLFQRQTLHGKSPFRVCRFPHREETETGATDEGKGVREEWLSIIVIVR